MTKIHYSIEPAWANIGYSDFIEIADEELAGLTLQERNARIHAIVREEVNEQCTWGWSEVATEEQPVPGEAGRRTVNGPAEPLPYTDADRSYDLHAVEADYGHPG